MQLTSKLYTQTSDFFVGIHNKNNKRSEQPSHIYTYLMSDTSIYVNNIFNLYKEKLNIKSKSSLQAMYNI